MTDIAYIHGASAGADEYRGLGIDTNISSSKVIFFSSAKV